MRMKPIRIILIVLIATTFVSTVAHGSADSTTTVVPLETERATKRKSGVRIGIVAGGVAGAGLFLLGAAAAESLCESECSDIGPLGYVGIGALGVVVGAATG